MSETRKAERRRRVARWVAVVMAGVVLGGIVAASFGLPWGLAVGVAALVVAHRGMIAVPGVAILTYHSVSPDPAWLPWSREISVHPETLDRHLATLRAMRANVIGTRELVELRATARALPPRAVVLHFDDGYLDNLLHAVPVLRRHGCPATIFASLDFVEPGDMVRREGADDGYMRWCELAEVAADPLIEVEPHGVAHARVPVSDRVVDRLDADNWRRHAWLQWDATPGPKHDWYRRAEPIAVPIGSAVPESGLALASRAWRDGRRETQDELEARIVGDLSACRRVFAERLGRAPVTFCWPENKVGAEGRRIAAGLGYAATTGGKARNAAGEPVDVLSRIHMGDRALGFRWQPAEALHLRAAVRLMQGNHYWYFVIAPMNAVRRIVMAIRTKLDRDFA